MTFELAAPAAFVIAYFAGSLPFGLIVGRLCGGIDIRREGSGNIGATNVARVLGAKYGVIVLALDCVKGAAPTALLPLLFLKPDSPERVHLAVLCGVAAILGHMFPCWLAFRGGKGVATALGVALVLAPLASAVALCVFALSMAGLRIVSLSSIIGACVYCGVEMWRLSPAPFSETTWSLALFSTVVPILIIVRHRANLARLMRGTEPKFRFGGKKDESDKPPDVGSGNQPTEESPTAMR
jgi:acyl phosphate:glycerol-3-phosphate acyltransferase